MTEVKTDAGMKLRKTKDTDCKKLDSTTSAIVTEQTSSVEMAEDDEAEKEVIQTATDENGSSSSEQ